MSTEIIDGAYRFRPLPTQQKVLDVIRSQNVPNIMLCGGFGSGKSRFGGEIGLQLALNVPNIEIIYWRKTRSSIEDTTYRIFCEQVCPEEFIKKHNRSKLLIKLKNGARFDFLGMDRVTRKGSYWGDVIILDESIEFEEPELKMIEGRLRGKHIKVPLLIYLTNPGPPGSYQHNLFVVNDEKPAEMRDKDFAYFSQTSFENTYNPPSYFDRLRKWEGTQYFSRYCLALWTAFKGSIYEQFDPKIHVIKPFKIPDNWPKKITVDFGYDNPLVILWIATDPGTNTKYVYRQYYKSHVLVRAACEKGKKVTEACRESISAARADHDAENRAQFEEYWMRTIPANKTVRSGIQAVQERLIERPGTGKRGLYIFDDSWAEVDNCWYGNFDRDLLLHEENKPENLQEEMPGYKWGPNDSPVKVGDHACDALRYDEFTDKTEKPEGGGIVKIQRQSSFGRQ